MSVIEQVRSRVGQKVISLVAGPEAEERRRQIFESPGPRTFDPHSPIARVHSDASMYVGGLRALLLQALHPVAMTAVAEHSRYRTDVWGRVASTSRFISVTTFGTVADAEHAVARVRGVHHHIRGRMPDGREYRADDPQLLQWVHAAEVDSFLTCYQRFGRSRLTVAEADEYVAQAGTIALRLGAEKVPATVAELAETIAGFRPELAGSPAAREAVRHLFAAPLSWTARVPYGTLCAVAVASLPLWARRMLGAPRLPGVDDIAVPALGYGVGVGVVGALRWVLPDPRARARE